MFHLFNYYQTFSGELCMYSPEEKQKNKNKINRLTCPFKGLCTSSTMKNGGKKIVWNIWILLKDSYCCVKDSGKMKASAPALVSSSVLTKISPDLRRRWQINAILIYVFSRRSREENAIFGVELEGCDECRKVTVISKKERFMANAEATYFRSTQLWETSRSSTQFDRICWLHLLLSQVDDVYSSLYFII